MAGYRYEYRCPNCGTQLQLRMRVTQTRRRCPECGHPVTPQEIDRQRVEGCLFGAVGVIAIALGGVSCGVAGLPVGVGVFIVSALALGLMVRWLLKPNLPTSTPYGQSRYAPVPFPGVAPVPPAAHLPAARRSPLLMILMVVGGAVFVSCIFLGGIGVLVSWVPRTTVTAVATQPATKAAAAQDRAGGTTTRPTVAAVRTQPPKMTASTRPAGPRGQTPQQARGSVPSAPREFKLEYREFDLYTEDPQWPRVTVKTNARSEAEFRQVARVYRDRFARAKGFDILFYAMDGPNPPPLTKILQGDPATATRARDGQVATYGFNRVNGRETFEHRGSQRAKGSGRR